MSNLKEISHELNIGLDSFIFIDDSDFEINLVNEQLPEVKLIHVPLNEIYNYADKIRKEFRIFNVYSETTEDQEKVQQYQAQLERKVNINQFNNIDEYLDSLNIEIKVNKNTYDDIIRVAQLTQKTNQFNLTSKRYTEQDIKNFINNGSIVLNINVSDNFGDSGITGLAIIKIDNVAYIDTFLLSCRVLGRKIEYKFIYYILNLLQKMGITKVVAIYQKTNKNEQVKEFYDQVGFNIISDDGLIKTYNLDLRNFNNKDINYIKILK